MLTRSFLIACASVLTVLPMHAQFSLPLPKPASSSVVRSEDLKLLFLTQRDSNGGYRRTEDSLRTELKVATRGTSARAALEVEVEAFCARFVLGEAECTTVSPDSLRAFLGDSTGDRRDYRETHIKSPFPLLGYNRPELAQYMRSAGSSEALAWASQFAANVSDKEAYVVSNIVRGLAGRIIVSADYALVVTRSDSGTAAKRDTIEGDRANLLRAVNNGGTLVARFTMPMYARTGTNMGVAAGLTGSVGFLGPIATPSEDKHAVASGVGEALASVALRSLVGDATQTAELILGLRGGYTLSDAPLRAGGAYKDLLYSQAVIGIRQNNSMSVSALVTVSNHKFGDLLPRVVLNFAAMR